jgi:hypothetical protein
MTPPSPSGCSKLKRYLQRLDPKKSRLSERARADRCTVQRYEPNKPIVADLFVTTHFQPMFMLGMRSHGQRPCPSASHGLPKPTRQPHTSYSFTRHSLTKIIGVAAATLAYDGGNYLRPSRKAKVLVKPKKELTLAGHANET